MEANKVKFTYLHDFGLVSMFSDFYFVSQAQNLMDYESEIYSRPKKIWFQTPKEKRQTANVAKVESCVKLTL